MLQHRWKTSEISQFQRKNTILFHSYEVPSQNSQRQKQTDNRQGLGKRTGQSILMGTELHSVLPDDEHPGVDGGDGCTTMWMYLKPLNTCKNGKIYVRYILPQFKNSEENTDDAFHFNTAYLFV